MNKCLRYAPKNDDSKKDDLLYTKFKKSIPKVPFNDPLDGIYCSETGKFIQFDKLQLFKDAQKTAGNISKSTLKELNDFLNLALNESLAYGVRMSALKSMNEAFYFYRNSALMKDFAGLVLNCCLSNMTKYGIDREVERTNLRISNPEEAQRDMNYNFSKETELVNLFSTIFNQIMIYCPFIPQLKLKTIKDIFQKEGLPILRTL